MRKDAISVTCLNLGDVGEVVVADGQFRVETGSSGRVLISLSDILIMLKALISLSNTSCVKEIDMLAMTDDI